MKTTKAMVGACYDNFHNTLRCFNGGTLEENRRMAAECHRRLLPIAERARALAANPSKRLAEDEWLMEALTVSIPRSLAAFEDRYIDTGRRTT